MADYKVVDTDQLDADLTTVANAIRTATGATGSLAFPAGFESALQGMKIIYEFHTVTIASTLNGTGLKTLLSGNSFVKKYYNSNDFFVILLSNTLPAATGAVSFIFHGNKAIGAAYEGISFRYSSASAVGSQPLNAPINGEGYSNHLRVTSEGNLNLYLGDASFNLQAGTYTIILLKLEG